MLLYRLCRAMAALALCIGLNACEDTFTLTVIIDPQGTGTGRAVSSDGIDCPGTCTAEVDFDESVDIIATPDPGSVFVSWRGSGCSGGTVEQITFQMTGNVTCTVRFDADPSLLVLTITHDPTGTGTGTVTGQQINCGADCTGSYPLNTALVLTVTPDAGSVFSGWGLDCGFLGTNQNPILTMDNTKDCLVKFDAVVTGGILVPRGSFTFDHRIEAGRFTATTAWTAGFDHPQSHIVDVSNPDNLTSPAGAEFNTCGGARGMTSFFDPRPPYNADIIYTTCNTNRSATSTLTTGGASQLTNFAFAPGEALLRPSTSWLAIVDFEFGKLHLQEQVALPAAEIVINLTNPLERSCPFSLAINADIAYVVGREGTAGTSTANCDNWRGMWRVDLSTNTVLGFTPFGTKPRIPLYFNNFVYVSDFEEDKIYVLNSTTGAVDHTIDVAGDGPVGMAIEDRTGFSDRMYVTNWVTNLVTVIDLTTELVVDTEPSGGVAPVKAFIQGSTLLVLNFGDAGTLVGAVLKAFSIQ